MLLNGPVNKLIRREWIALVVLILSPLAGCSSSSGLTAVDAGDAGDDTTATGMPDTAPTFDANCDPSLTYATFGMNFFASYCNRCHAWNQESAQLYGGTIADYAGNSASMPPSSPFPTPDERTQLVNWIACGAP